MKPKIEKFKDLTVWPKALSLCVAICSKFSNCNYFGFRDHIRRAAVSVPSNIEEGFKRHYNKEFIQFLYIAKGSAGEVRTQLLIT